MYRSPCIVHLYIRKVVVHNRIGSAVSEIDSLILPPLWRQAWSSRTSPEYWKVGPLRHNTESYRSILPPVWCTYQTQRYCADMPRLEGKFVICVSRKHSLVSIAVPRLFIPTFVYFLYPRIGSKSVWLLGVGWHRCFFFFLNSASIRSLVVDIMPFTLRDDMP